MMNSLVQIDIPKRSSACFRGGERLVPGMEYYSLLIQDDQQKFIRQDFCLACWQHHSLEVSFDQSQGYWKSRIEMKKENVPQDQSKMGRALALFKNLTQEIPQNEAEIFVLALFLAHARRFILRRELEQEEHFYFLYELAGQDEFFTVKKMELSQLETTALQQSLAKKLS